MLSSFGVNCKKIFLLQKHYIEAHLREERYLAHWIVETSDFELTNLKMKYGNADD